MLDKEKIIVVALGKLYQKYRMYIQDKFSIVALTDNNPLKLEAGEDSCKYISIDKITEEIYDKVLICTEEQYIPLKVQLIQMGVSPGKIYGLDLLEQALWEDDYQKYINDMTEYKQMHKTLCLNSFELKESESCIKLSDYRKNAGEIDGHYFYQDILVASKIIKENPVHHMDVGSRIDGFVSHLLAAGIETTVTDIRPLPVREMGFGIPRLNFIQADATEITGIEDNSVASLSSLHAVEHFGLGRYGDVIDPLAWLKALHSLERILAYGGILYLSVPVGREEKLMFNGHRIFSPITIVEALSKLSLNEMYIIHDKEIYRYAGDEVLEGKPDNHLGSYDCGIFVFSKIDQSNTHQLPEFQQTII